MKDFYEMIDKLNFIDDMKEFFNIKEKLLDFIISSSYSVCLIGGIIGIILYTFGLKKAKNSGSIALGVYLILNILANCLK